MKKLFVAALLFLTYSTFAQTKFIKEYPVSFIVDKYFIESSGNPERSLNKITDRANLVLSQADTNDLGIRFRYNGIVDTMNFGSRLNNHAVLDSLSNYPHEGILAFFTGALTYSPVIRGVQKTSTLFTNGTSKPSDDVCIIRYPKNPLIGNVYSAHVFAHEGLHIIGVPHDKSIYENLMSKNPSSPSGVMTKETKNEI